MAVVDTKKRPQLVKDFWPAYRMRLLVITGLNASILALVAALVLVYFAHIGPSRSEFWISIGVTFAASYVLGLILFFVNSKPLNDLLAAIVHLAGERSNITPPHPNDAYYQKTGLAPALQLLYKLGSENGATTGDKTTQTDGDTINVAAALNAAQTGFVVLGDDRRITFASSAAPIASDGKTTSLQLLFGTNDTLDTWLDTCEKTAVHAEKVWNRIPNKPADQEDQRLYDIYASYEKGAAYETVLTLIDRTDFYKTDEEDLNFISFAAHELRGPITVIRGYLDVLQDELGDTIDPDQQELFRRLTVSANRLSSYINNILNTSRYDRRHLSVQLAEDTVANIYATIKDDMELRASSQNRLLSVAFPEDLPTIAADRASISEVLGNLIDNAIKYSNEGGAITVTAAAKGDFVEVSVADRGIGMPANVVRNLFQKFYRSHRSRETVAGTGIGLYISKAIIESHGGTISARSAEGEGSVFTVAIPTYASVADKLHSDNNSNQGLINEGKGWIKNHSMYRG